MTDGTETIFKSCAVRQSKEKQHEASMAHCANWLLLLAAAYSRVAKTCHEHGLDLLSASSFICLALLCFVWRCVAP